MPNALDTLLARRGKSRADFKRNTRMGRIFRTRGVSDSAELRRIIKMPAHDWQEGADALAQELNSMFGKRPATCPKSCVCRGQGYMTLRSIQAGALEAIHDFGGLLGPIRVGGGKTLISYLAGPVAGAKRVLLLVPAKLKKKTLRDFARLHRHWEAPENYHIMSYELLSRDRGVEELNSYKPDMLIADEAHKLKNLSAACTKRVRRYMKTHPETAYVDMSGTTTKRSLMDFYHRQAWALQDSLHVLPKVYNQTREWADALDEKIDPLARLAPGHLVSLCTDKELERILAAPHETQTRITRQAYQRRLMSTPGVVGTTETYTGEMSLTIQGVEWEPSPGVIDAFQLLRDKWERPDGYPIEQAANLWQLARCLIQGFYYRWVPDPPKEWLAARRSWAQCVREILKNYRDLDTPMVVARAVDQGRVPWAEPALTEWREVRETYEPTVETHWVDDRAIRYCADWAKKNRGIIWTSEKATGIRLQADCGIPYYGEKGLCGSKMIEDETESCVASIAANSEGRNLQQFDRALVISPPPGGAVWEQMLGRMHRDGQESDEVSVDVALGCRENWAVFDQARRDAEYAESMLGQVQKLNLADLDVPNVDEIDQRSGPHWEGSSVQYFKRP